MEDNTSEADTEDRDVVAVLAEWVRSIPAGGVVTWGQPHVVHGDVHTGWVDVSVAGADLPFNWLWEIVPPDETDTGVTSIPLPYDKTVWAVWDQETFDIASDDADALTVVTDAGESPGDVELGRLEDVAAVDPERRTVIAKHGWSSDAICRALERWCKERAGRDDILFAFDSEYNPYRESGLLDTLDERLESYHAGTVEAYEIAPGVRALDPVMDDLLAMNVDDAAKITDAMSKLTGR